MQTDDKTHRHEHRKRDVDRTGVRSSFDHYRDTVQRCNRDQNDGRYKQERSILEK